MSGRDPRAGRGRPVRVRRRARRSAMPAGRSPAWCGRARAHARRVERRSSRRTCSIATPSQTPPAVPTWSCTRSIRCTPSWTRFALPLTYVAIDAAEAVGATLMFPGNVYNYGAGMPEVIDETTPMQPTTRKGKLRARDRAAHAGSLRARRTDDRPASRRLLWARTRIVVRSRHHARFASRAHHLSGTARCGARMGLRAGCRRRHGAACREARDAARISSRSASRAMR